MSLISGSASIIIGNLYVSPLFNKALVRLVPKPFRDDMRQHIALLLYDMNIEKLSALYNSDRLNHYVFGMIVNQYRKGKCKSTFWKLHETKNIDMENPKLLDHLYQKQFVDDSLQAEFRNYLDENLCQVLSKVLEDFYQANNDSISYFFNRTIFGLYFIENKTMKQISKETDINYTAVRNSILFTLDYVNNHPEINRIKYEFKK
jgi:hypothetical protein